MVKESYLYAHRQESLLTFIKWSPPNFRSRGARTRLSAFHADNLESSCHHRSPAQNDTQRSSTAIAMELRKASSTLLPRLRVSQRTFSTSPRHHALPTATTTTSAKPVESSTTEEKHTPAFDWSSQGSRSRRSIFPAPSTTERIMNKGNSSDMILHALRQSREGKSAASQRFDLSRMADPGPENVGDIMRGLNETVAAPALPKQPMRLTPSTGRTVVVGSGVDIGRAIRLMEQSCARNKVRADFTKQRFHERGGLKRKRLRRERWRKHFKTGFKQAVDRVKLLKKQGW